MTTTDLGALISSRICHDLISPLGAIGNGVELLNMSGHADSPEIALIAESVENANARIRFFRIAFGAAHPSVEINQSEVQRVLRDSYRNNRIAVQWMVEGPLLRQEVKTAFLALQCLENGLPWGGEISISRDHHTWSLVATGEKIRFETDLWKVVAGETSLEDIVASDVHFALLGPAAEAAGSKIRQDVKETGISLSF